MWSTSTTAHKWMLHSMVWFLSWCRHRWHTTVADHTTGIMTSVLPCPATAPSHTWVTGIWRCIWLWTLTSNLALTLSKPCLITVAIIPVINIHGDVCVYVCMYIYIYVCVCVLKYLGVIQVNCLVIFESERALCMTYVYVSLHWLLLCAVIGWNSCSFRTCMF